MKTRQRVGFGIFALLLIGVVIGPDTFLTNNYGLQVAWVALYFGVLCATWSLLAGVNGQFSFVHVTIPGVAAYSGAIIVTESLAHSSVVGNVWIAIVLGTASATVLGTALGLLLRQLRGAYFALFTLAFAEIVRRVIVGEVDVTGGELSLATPLLPGSLLVHYYAMFGFLAITLGATYWILRRRLGLFLRASREDLDLAASLGVKVDRLRLAVFVIVSAVLGLCGCLYYFANGRISPEDVDLLFMSQVVAYAAIGGFESPLAAGITGVAMAFVVVQLTTIQLGQNELRVVAMVTLLAAALGLWVIGSAWRKNHQRFAAQALRSRLPSSRILLATLIPVGLVVTSIVLFSLPSLVIDIGLWQYGVFGAIVAITIRLTRNGLLTPALNFFAGRTEAMRRTVEERALPSGGAIAPIPTDDPLETGRYSRAQAPRLEVRELGMSFGDHTVLESVTFEIAEPQICGLIGPNGAGKTTLVNLLCGTYVPTHGAIFLGGERVDGLRSFDLARKGLVRSYQVPRSFKRMTVMENMLVPGLVAQPKSGPRLRRKAESVLSALGMQHLESEYARALSGGQQKLLELARLTMLDPWILVLDEPFAGVHARLRSLIADYIRQQKKRGVAIIVIEHDMEGIFKLADRLLVLANGSLLLDGSPAEVRHDERVMEAYLARSHKPPAS